MTNSRIALIILGIVSIGLMVFSATTFTSKLQLEKEAREKQEEISSLQDQKKKFVSQVKDLEDKSLVLEKTLISLEDEKERLLSQRDSVQRLLTYSRANEQNSRNKIAQLQKQLSQLQTKLSDVQQKYDDLLNSSGTAGEEYRKRVEELTTERNQLASENQRLQQELLAATGNADNRTAIFTKSMNAIPGELKRGKFSASTRSQNIDRVQINFMLSRPPKPTENLIFKVFDHTNKEISVKASYRNELNAPADPVNQKVILEFEGGKLDRKIKGTYSVRLYMTDVNKGLENQEIGTKEFQVK